MKTLGRALDIALATTIGVMSAGTLALALPIFYNMYKDIDTWAEFIQLFAY